MRRAAGAPRAGPSARVVPVLSVSLRASPCVSVRRFRTSSCDVLGQRLRVDLLMTLRDPCGACPDTWRVRADTMRVRGAAPLESGTAAPLESGTYVEPPARPPRTRRAQASRVHLSPGGAEHARYGTGTRWVRGAKSGERRGGCCAALGSAGSAPGPRRGCGRARTVGLRNSFGTAPGRPREGFGKAPGAAERGRGGGWMAVVAEVVAAAVTGCVGRVCRGGGRGGGSGGEEGCACPAGSCQRTCQPGAAASCMAFLPCSVPIQVPPACL